MADANYDDGLPNVVLEAQSSGKPVIISPLPAASEGVVSGTNGWVLSKVDAVDEFVTVLEELVAQPNTVLEAGRAARDFVENHHDRARLYNQLSSLIRTGMDPAQKQPLKYMHHS